MKSGLPDTAVPPSSRASHPMRSGRLHKKGVRSQSDAEVSAAGCGKWLFMNPDDSRMEVSGECSA